MKVYTIANVPNATTTKDPRIYAISTRVVAMTANRKNVPFREGWRYRLRCMCECVIRSQELNILPIRLRGGGGREMRGMLSLESYLLGELVLEVHLQCEIWNLRSTMASSYDTSVISEIVYQRRLG